MVMPTWALGQLGRQRPQPGQHPGGPAVAVRPSPARRWAGRARPGRTPRRRRSPVPRVSSTPSPSSSHSVSTGRARREALGTRRAGWLPEREVLPRAGRTGPGGGWSLWGIVVAMLRGPAGLTSRRAADVPPGSRRPDCTPSTARSCSSRQGARTGVGARAADAGRDVVEEVLHAGTVAGRAPSSRRRCPPRTAPCAPARTGCPPGCEQRPRGPRPSRSSPCSGGPGRR